MIFDNYKHYQTEDFALDDDFIKLAKGFSVDGNTLDQLKSHLPEKRKEISLAVEILKGLITNKDELNNERKELLLTRIFQANQKQFRLVFIKYAASILLLIGLGFSLNYLFLIVNPQI
jgi:hypothetical protein